jgi:hypothetical protein
LKPLPNELLVIIIKINLTTNYQLLLNCNKVHRARLDILSTYLPIFPPMKGEVLKELSDQHKATILYDALPYYYIKKRKEANTEPIDISLEVLFQFAHNILEAAIDHGKDAEGNPRNSKEQKTETSIPRKQGVKVKAIRRVD